MALLGALIITPDTLLIRLSGLEGWPLTTWRGSLIGGSILVAWIGMTGRQIKADLKQMSRAPSLLIMVAFAGNTLCFNFAVVETSIIVVLTALATVPILAAFLSFAILRERTKWRTWLAIIFTMAGVLTVIFNGETAVAAPTGNVFLGSFLGFMTAFCMAVVFVITHRYPHTPVLLAISLGTLSTGLIGFLGTNIDEMMNGSLWVILVMGLIVMPLALSLLTLAPRYTSPTNVSLLMLLEMVLGPFWVWLGTGERPSPIMLFGAAIVLVTLAGYIISTPRTD
ncbi:MAG: hypothetical protein CBB68_05120 [Rhodospirillaceae bacterium TMED8]|nr:hypothetical protein [Magnetovibrio sp.]OUT51706.1 MAG: hypothetical protein CBB68_05120 [Rhodospirillaceae bacterium TMED8]|tara:strand:+ start:556 stop:1401 length:846 start_codon:yes stop_codon:yes gene_type:complete